MRRKLFVFSKTSLLLQRISITTSLVLVILTIGTFFLKTSPMINDLSVVQKNADNETVKDNNYTTRTIKNIEDDSDSSINKGIFRYFNNHFQNSVIWNKEHSSCYVVSNNHWDNDDDDHFDEEDREVYDEEDRENEYKREDT